MNTVCQADMPDIPLDFAPLRPPANAYADPVAAADWRTANFPATSWTSPAMRLVLIDPDQPADVRALYELVIRPMQDAAARRFGDCFALGVVTPDPSTRFFVEAGASSTGAVVFFASSTDEAPRALRPSGALTHADESSLDAVIALGGAVTAAELAAHDGLEAAAASNRLVQLEKKGFLIRYRRNKREGDLFVDPGSRAMDPQGGASLAPEEDLPDEVRTAALSLAAADGRPMGEILTEAWRAYLATRMDDVNAAIAAGQGRSGRAMAPEPDDDDRAWAEAAAARARGA